MRQPTSVAAPGAPPEQELEQVLRWRLEQLRRAGYDRRQAALLAERPDVDLHEAAGLLARGCPPETAIRILL